MWQKYTERSNLWIVQSATAAEVQKRRTEYRAVCRKDKTIPTARWLCPVVIFLNVCLYKVYSTTWTVTKQVPTLWTILVAQPSYWTRVLCKKCSSYERVQGLDFIVILQFSEMVINPFWVVNLYLGRFLIEYPLLECKQLRPTRDICVKSIILHF